MSVDWAGEGRPPLGFALDEPGLVVGEAGFAAGEVGLAVGDAGFETPRPRAANGPLPWMTAASGPDLVTFSTVAVATAPSVEVDSTEADCAELVSGGVADDSLAGTVEEDASESLDWPIFIAKSRIEERLEFAVR